MGEIKEIIIKHYRLLVEIVAVYSALQHSTRIVRLVLILRMKAKLIHHSLLTTTENWEIKTVPQQCHSFHAEIMMSRFNGNTSVEVIDQIVSSTGFEHWSETVSYTFVQCES